VQVKTKTISPRPMRDSLNDSVIKAVQRQGQLIAATQELINDATNLARISRTKRTVKITEYTSPGEHPHGPSYYSAKTLSSELELIDAELSKQEEILSQLQSQCTAEQKVQSKLLQEIRQSAAEASLRASDDIESNSSIHSKSPSSYLLIQQHNQVSKPPPKLSNVSMNNIRTALLCYQRHLDQKKRMKKLHQVFASPKASPADLSKNNRTDNGSLNDKKTPQKSILSWEMAQTSFEKQRQDDRQGLWTLGLASNRIAQQAKAGLAKTRANLRSKSRRRSVMLRGVASSSTVPSPGNFNKSEHSGDGATEENELSVSADWLIRRSNSTFNEFNNLGGAGESGNDGTSNYDRDDRGGEEGSSMWETDSGGATGRTSSSNVSNGRGRSMSDEHTYSSQSVPTQWLRMIFNRMDKDGSGDVDRTEFIEGMKNDSDMLQLFDMTSDDSSTLVPSFQDISNTIDVLDMS
jgi:hypothetical protein